MVHLQAADIRWKSQGHGRQGPGDVADVVRTAGYRAFRRFADAGKLPDQAPGFFVAHQFLQGASEDLVFLGPLRQADLADVLVHRQRDRPVEMPRIGGADYAAAHAGVGHHRRALGDAVQRFVVLANAFRFYLANEIPDAGVGGHDIGLFATGVDHVMRALQRMQVFAPVVPGDVRKLHRIERAAPLPGIAGAMGGDAVEHVFNGNQPRAPGLAPAHAHGAGNVGVQHRVDVFEKTVPGVPGLGAEQFLGDARPDHDGTGHVLALHDFLDRQRRDNDDRLTGIMTFAVARTVFDHGLPIGYARHLRSPRNAIDIRTERDHRPAFAPGRPPGRRNACHAEFHLEIVFHQEFGQIALGLEFLEAELGIGEQAVDDFLIQL